MSQPTSADPKTTPANPGTAPAVEPGFEVKLQAYWAENRSMFMIAFVAVILVIVGREGWQYFSTAREKSVQDDYAKIADQPDKLAGFADEHSGHALAGVAYLRLADQKFEAADYKQAAAFYTKASGSLKNDVLVGRARLGNAMSLVASGDQAAGEADLKVVGADQALLKAVRSEAIYHLASMAAESGRSDEVKRLVDEVGKIDLGGAWSQRATVLLTRQQVSEAVPAALTFKPSGG